MAMKTTINFDDFADDIRIEEVDLDNSFRSQASLFANYAVMGFNAMRSAADKKIILDVTRSEIDREIRQRAEDEATAETDPKKVKKITEASITAEIDRTKKYVIALRGYNEAQAIEKLSANALEAFKQRRDMLVQLGANQREDKKGDLWMKGKEDATTAERFKAMETLKAIA